MSKQEIKTHYILLWVIVIIISVITILSHVVFLVGLGRWQCIESKPKLVITYTNMNGLGEYTKKYIPLEKEGMINEEEIKKIHGCFEYERNSWCPTDITTESKCIKEAWIKKS